ncbi:hypothetical protein K9U40_11805 [Xanthobacter autotrophicus]|uniref:hypothetical protein n=1 Tax=Xanthobacter TaxID=279 RepID=UPI0024AA2319|nr:hypothetical protein [Xanthobacter autotrophicus]MDI4665010.1 hypothetical protein [Xanthobacter autotrophicus]
MVPSLAARMVIREASLGEERHAELMGLRNALSGAPLKAAMAQGQASGPEAAAEAVGKAGGKSARRAVRLNPLAWMAVSFLAGTVVGALLRPVTARTGGNSG